METNELDRIIDWCRIPIVHVTFTIACEACGREVTENDSYRGCCSFSCYCAYRCIDREDG